MGSMVEISDQDGPNLNNDTLNPTHRVEFKESNGIEISSLAPAISVRNAYKAYSNGIPILNNFNMTVPQNSIYGLLGASGCGKTTILSCLVGIRKLDVGEITVFGERPGTPECGIPGRCVGYMPQDIALYGQLTIFNILQYFGRIFGMRQSKIVARIEFLTSFLDLPPSSRRIEDLSGGQMRRVSLSACLLHEPPLLILDEPTVGVDPILRHRIWEYLSDMVATKHTTVIITSHYIEEARRSNTVGLMRNGRLLTEKSPEVLMKEHNAIFLEDIVLKFCLLDEKDEVKKAVAENSFYSNNAKESSEEKAVVGLKFKSTNQFDETEHQNKFTRPQLRRRQSLFQQAEQGVWEKFSRTRAVAVRNILLLLRSPEFLLVIFFMPTFQVIICNLTLGPEPKHLKFGIVDPEINYNLSKCSELPKNGCLLDNLSCRFVNSLPNNIIEPLSMKTKEEALEYMENGVLRGYMEFPQNFSKHLADRAALGKFAENDTLKGSTISLRLDMSDYFAGALLTKGIYQSYLKFTVQQLSDCDQNIAKGEIPIRFRKPVYGSNEGTFQDYMTPGVLLMILYFIPYVSCAVSNITDRKQGTLDRSMVAGVNVVDILMAFLLTEGFLVLAQTIISLLVVLFVFQTVILGSIFWYLILTILTGFAGLSLGFLVAQIIDEEKDALIIGVGLYLPMLLMSGITWPLEAAPWTIRYFSYYCTPCTLAITSMRSIVSKGHGITNSEVFPGYLNLIVWILGCWILGILIMRARTR